MIVVRVIFVMCVSTMIVPMMSVFAERLRVIMRVPVVMLVVSVLMIVAESIVMVTMVITCVIMRVKAGLAGVSQIPQVIFAPGFVGVRVSVAVRWLVGVSSAGIGKERDFDRRTADDRGG
jgi:hypothetical protein